MKIMLTCNIMETCYHNHTLIPFVSYSFLDLDNILVLIIEILECGSTKTISESATISLTIVTLYCSPPNSVSRNFMQSF